MMDILITGIVKKYISNVLTARRTSIFGNSHIEKSRSVKIDVLARLLSSQATACDRGLVELYEGDWLENVPTF